MSRRVIVIEWTTATARNWWTYTGRRARFPGRARAFIAMLREWVLNYARPTFPGRDIEPPFADVPEPEPVRLTPASPTTRVLTPAHIRTTVHAIAPPSLRRPTVGRTSLTP